MKKHKITFEEKEELNNIRELLKCSDEECVKLGIELLKNYPLDSRIYHFMVRRYSLKLGYILTQYNDVINYYSGMSIKIYYELFWRKKIINFINACLVYGKFYV